MSAHFRARRSALGALRSGFTLVEVLVVIGVTSLLASLIVTYTSDSRDQVALAIEQAKLAQTVSRAKSLALATYGRREAGGSSSVIPCGYGVSINYDTHAYALFSYPPGECRSIPRIDPQIVAENIVDAITLPRNVRFRSPGPESASEILFVPPDPTTFIWNAGDNATSTFGKIIMNPPGGSPSRAVEVGIGGQITF